MTARTLALLALLSTALPAAADPLAIFECRERLGRDWPQTLISYQKQFPPGAAREGQLRLLDAAGQERPLQLWRIARHPDGSIASARISFLAQLPANGSYHFELHPNPPAPSEAAPSDREEPDRTLLENSLVAIRLPRAGEAKFDPPLPMAATYAAAFPPAAPAPGPIQGVRLADGQWTGGSGFLAANPAAAPRITGCTCRISEQGPLFVEARVRYTFTNGGWYELTARLFSNDPALRIDEQFDTGPAGNRMDYQVVFSLAGRGGAWKPDAAYWISPGERLKGRDEQFQARLREAGLPAAPDCGSTSIAYDAPEKQLFEVAVRYPWHPVAHFFGLVNSASLTRDAIASGKLPFLAVIPMHTGNWRNSVDNSDAALFSHAPGEVALHFPLRAGPHPRGMLHTGEYDPDQPLTLCRRQWALVAGPFQPFDRLWSFRAQEGYVTLDDYKDWTLDWQPDPKVEYPRLFFGREDLDRLKARMSQFPDAQAFSRFLYVNDTDARREQLWKSLTYDGEWSGPIGNTRHLLSKGDPPNIPWAITYRVSQMAGWAGDADELLSSPRLSPEQRQRLRAHIAAFCYTITEPDVNPRGAMTHLGNPNMPINRFMGLAWAAALIPDHPMSKTWLDLAADYLRYKLAIMAAPGGAWGELVSYYNASGPHLLQTAGILARAGRLDPATARLAVQSPNFTFNLLTPRDPRFDARITPGFGHEGIDQAIQFLPASNVIRAVDPQLAAAFVWAWNAAGRPMNGHHDAGFSPRLQANAELLETLPAGFVPPQLNSAWLPGFGATLRAHPGQPNETYLAFRQGYNVSHNDANQGDFTLYAGGAPLVPIALQMYALHNDSDPSKLFQTFGYHSRVRFGAQDNTGGWPGGGALGGVPAHGFTDSVDYVRAVSDEGPQRWTRQIALLKSKSPASPSYFLFRDSFAPLQGEDQLQPKWWCLRTLGTKNQVQPGPGEFTYTSEFGPRLNVHFLQPGPIKLESREALHKNPLYFVNAANWRRAHGDPKGDGSAVNVEETLTINAIGPIPPRQDVLVALYPLTGNQQPPRYEPWANGMVCITTPESTDYILLERQPTRCSSGDVMLEGVAAAVRVFKDEVHLIVSEGPGTVIYQGATLRSDRPALKVIPRSEIARKPVYEITTPWTLPAGDLPAGCRIDGQARCTLKIAANQISGRSEGFGGLLYIPMPPGLKVLPMLLIDGQPCAPGTHGGMLIIPLMPGPHAFEVRDLPQPPVFRNWQYW